MQIRFLKLGLAAIFAASMASLGAIVLLVNPYRAGALNLALFSALFFLVLFSIFSWFGFWVRKNFMTEKNQNRILKMVFRQGSLVAVLVVICLWLAHFKMLKIWIALPVLFVLAGMEYYFLTRHEYHNQTTGN